ncbi:uncharacterized protein LOC108674841 [Hyalella azteca]|uniref:Uncharacterized protein LOC108674841 n=1 Tax=Hyalella azteca TaxID=294128 RepID=A0A979FGL6_HYAAZ|nr:uncharacterized protein LOC108674841 [Hyalella azteca]
MEARKLANGAIRQVASGPSGWLRSPGYPKFYIGPEPCDFTVSLDPGQKMSLSFTDVQLKERDGGACRDTVTVQDESGRLYQRCGTLHRPELVQSEHHIINITLHTDQQMVPARGFLAYYKAFGCPNPPVPANATAVFRNASHAKLACRDGHAFVRDDDGAVAKYLMLECRQQMWPAVDDCVGLQDLLAAGEITQDEFQRLFNETANVDILVKSHFSRILDYYIPVAIMTVLVLGNIIIILTIFYCRRALKEMASDEWDSIKSNPEPPDECDPDPTAPSRV